jgi:transposase
MTRPTKHPKTGIYRLRKQIPASLQDIAAQMFGVRGEFIINFNTKDADEARQRAPAEIARRDERMNLLRTAATSEGTRLTLKQVHGLAGAFYRKEEAKWADDPGNGLLYVLSTGCQWRYVPKDLPPKSTLYGYFDLWTYHGVTDRIHHALYLQCRERVEREASPTACIIDSQSVKSAEKGGPALIRTATMQARKSRARSDIS